MKEELEFAYQKRKRSRKLLGWVIKIIVLIVIFVIGFLIGYFVTKPGKTEAIAQSNKAKFHAAFQNSISTEKLEENVRFVIL